MTKNLSRAEGIVYGLATGDALGRVTEFMSLHHIKSAYGLSGWCKKPKSFDRIDGINWIWIDK